MTACGMDGMRAWKVAIRRPDPATSWLMDGAEKRLSALYALS